MNVWTFVGGPVFWLLAAMGVAATVIFLVRLLGLRRAHIDYVDFIHGVGNLLSGGKADEALTLCDDTAVPVARVVAAAIRHRTDSARALRESIDTAGRVEVGRIARRFAALAIIAQTAPLLGLFGTFVGGIHAVNALNGAALVARADLLSGLMEALVSAAAGLLVGIPAQVMYSVLRVRFERLVIELEAAASEVLVLLTAQRGDNRVKGRSEWNWLPPPDEGIWRHGAAWMRPFAVSAPWITLAILMGLMALSDRRFTAASGVALDLPSAAIQDADVAGLVALVLPLAREVGGGEETFVFFDDARFTLSDPSSAAALRRSLEERVATAKHSTLLLLADRRVPSGDLMNLTGLARSAGVRQVQIAEKRD